MSNPNLQKIIKLTQAQYDTLSSGGTVGDYTGLNDNYLYLIQDDAQYATESYVNTAISTLDNNVVHKGTSSSTGIAENIYGSKTFEAAIIEQGSIYSTYVTRTYTESAQLTSDGVEVGYQSSGAISSDATATIGARNIVFTETETSGTTIAPYYTSYEGRRILYNPIANESSTAYIINLPQASGTLTTTDDVTKILRFI